MPSQRSASLSEHNEKVLEAIKLLNDTPAPEVMQPKRPVNPLSAMDSGILPSIGDLGTDIDAGSGFVVPSELPAGSSGVLNPVYAAALSGQFPVVSNFLGMQVAPEAMGGAPKVVRVAPEAMGAPMVGEQAVAPEPAHPKVARMVPKGKAKAYSRYHERYQQESIEVVGGAPSGPKVIRPRESMSTDKWGPYLIYGAICIAVMVIWLFAGLALVGSDVLANPVMLVLAVVILVGIVAGALIVVSLTLMIGKNGDGDEGASQSVRKAVLKVVPVFLGVLVVWFILMATTL